MFYINIFFGLSVTSALLYSAYFEEILVVEIQAIFGFGLPNSQLL